MKKLFLKVASVVTTVFALMLGTSCTEEKIEKENGVNTSEVVPVSWTPERMSYTIHIGESVTVDGTLAYSNGKTQSMKGLCTSLNPSVVRASESFEALGMELGTAKVLAKVSFTDQAGAVQVFDSEVTIEVVPEAGDPVRLELVPDDITIGRGESFIYTVTVVYQDGRRKEIAPSLCDWDVEDDGAQHLSYGKDGKITGMQGPGETVVTATYDKEGPRIRASSRVFVED